MGLKEKRKKKKKKAVTFFGLGSDFQFGRPGYLRLGLIHDLEQSEGGLILAYHRYQTNKQNTILIINHIAL